MQYVVRVVRGFDEPESAWTAPEGKTLYRGDDEAAAREAKAGFDSVCDPNEGAIIERRDGRVLRDDTDEWQAPQ